MSNFGDQFGFDYDPDPGWLGFGLILAIIALLVVLLSHFNQV